MPAIKQNELIFYQTKYVNAQLPKLFCSLFRFPLASRINQKSEGTAAHKHQKAAWEVFMFLTELCVYYFTHAVTSVGLSEGNNSFRFLQKHRTGNHR